MEDFSKILFVIATISALIAIVTCVKISAGRGERYLYDKQFKKSLDRLARTNRGLVIVTLAIYAVATIAANIDSLKTSSADTVTSNNDVKTEPMERR